MVSQAQRGGCLLEELQRIDLLVRLQVYKLRRSPESPEACCSLSSTPAAFESVVAAESSAPESADGSGLSLQRLLEQLTALQERLAARKAAACQAGERTRLERLGECFHLSPFDVDVLLICLALELDLRYETLYAYLQGDRNRKRPSVALALTLLCPSRESQLEARDRFAPTAPLLAYHLLALGEAPGEPQPPLLARSLRLDERIVAYLLGSDQLDSRLLPCLRWGETPLAWHELVLPADVHERLTCLRQGYSPFQAPNAASQQHSWDVLLYLQGPAGVGKQATATALCGELGLALLVVDSGRLLQAEMPFAVAVRLLVREALLQQAALYFANFEALLVEDEHRKACREMLLEELEHLTGLTFLAGQTRWEPPQSLQRKACMRVELPLPSAPLRKRLWETCLNGAMPADLDLDGLVNTFLLSGGQIRAAVRTACQTALWRDPPHGRVTGPDLYDACRAHSSQKLTALAHKIQPHYGWDDIVLPPEPLAQLREMVTYVRHRQRVYGEWGFDQRLSLGKGLNALFAGPSGTGKTMAAEIMANALRLDLYRIDLSTVISKYIGETEKNLRQIFHEARHANAILFFDEADALFGKRSEVKDAHDRYANIEIAYLLQEMEAYDGIVILATNLRKNMDEAFVRRMQAVVEFPLPEESERQRLWQGMFPPQAPLAADIDWGFLARQFKLTGGHIKNIALHAAFLAAEAGSSIGMVQLIQATKREFHKLGRLCSQAEFLRYYDLVKAEGAR
ncbi:MAG: AAA family ATPase [Candidatus Tectimicrobiota bacterium]